MKEVSMRFEVSIILSVAKQKERSDSNPKGIGDVTSRPQRRLFSPEFMRFAGCPAMVAARDRLGAHPTSEGLYLDGGVAGYDSFALGLVRRIDSDRPVLGGSPDCAISLSAVWGSCQHVSGIHQDPTAVDNRIGRPAAADAARADAAGPGRLLACAGLRDVRGRREPCRTAPHTIARERVFFLPQEASLPQAPPTEKSVGPPLEEVEFSPVVAHDDVACRDGFALGLADRSGRQQRTRASFGNAVGPAGGISRGRRRRLRRLRIHPGGARQRASPVAAGRIARPTPETAGLCSGVCKYRVSLARARGQTTPAPAGFTTGRGSRWQTSGVSGDQSRFQTPAH